MVSTYSSVSGKWEPVSKNTTSMVGSTLTAISMSTASWKDAAMANLGPKRSTAQATINPAGADSKADACSSISSHNWVNSDLLATMLTFTTLSLLASNRLGVGPSGPASRNAVHAPSVPVPDHHQETLVTPFAFPDEAGSVATKPPPALLSAW